jgi:hypothetical protein
VVRGGRLARAGGWTSPKPHESGQTEPPTGPAANHDQPDPRQHVLVLGRKRHPQELRTQSVEKLRAGQAVGPDDRRRPDQMNCLPIRMPVPHPRCSKVKVERLRAAVTGCATGTTTTSSPRPSRVPLLRDRSSAGEVHAGSLRKGSKLTVSRTNFAGFMLDHATDHLDRPVSSGQRRALTVIAR